MVIGCSVWMVSRESESVRKARGLKLGMTIAEVDALMGEPHLAIPGGEHRMQFAMYATPAEHRMNRLQAGLHHVAFKAGLIANSTPPELPVVVSFASGRVHWFRRGGEVVGQ